MGGGERNLHLLLHLGISKPMVVFGPMEFLLATQTLLLIMLGYLNN
jgi:hypothetical protein